MSEQALDKSGRPISVGDLVIYGHALGRCAALQYGKILAIKWKEGYDRSKRASFTVQGVGLSDNGTHSSHSASMLQKGTLQFGSRILVITRDQVPAKVLALLDEVQP